MKKFLLTIFLVPQITWGATAAEIHSPEKLNHALFHAIEAKDQSLCIELLKKGADVNTVDRKGDTPLMAAAKKGLTDICARLIEIGANVDAVDYSERTALYVAAERGNEAVCGLLIKAGANVNAIDGFEDTPLHYAALSGFAGICTTLIKAGADWSAIDRDGATPLHHAAAGGFVDVCALLIGAGADVKAVNEGRNTALHDAAYEGLEGICATLVKAGSDVDLEVVGNTPLRLAQNINTRNRKGLAQKMRTSLILLRAGAKITIEHNGVPKFLLNKEELPALLGCIKGERWEARHPALVRRALDK